VTEDSHPIYKPGDVVYGSDPYKGADAARPWLIIANHEEKPFHGEQYIGLSLTTRTWMEDLIEIEETDWIYGGTPDDSRLVPWAVQSLDSADIDFWQGRLDEVLVERAIRSLVAYLQS
jgi:hypothetical protein